MDDLHNTLEAGGYGGHEAERFLVRVLFCLFAEDTGIFEREAFRLYIMDRTQPDGSDLGLHLERLFAVLNTPRAKRQKNLDETLDAFPYVNGDLFAERLGFADLNRDMRNSLLACTTFDWSQISPAIFGSLFQGVMESRERRQNRRTLHQRAGHLEGGPVSFPRRLAEQIRVAQGQQASTEAVSRRNWPGCVFLDPACGCGNFLVIAYRELRLLEIGLLKLLAADEPAEAPRHSNHVEDRRGRLLAPVREQVASGRALAMWLMDHQMNVRLSEAFGQYYAQTSVDQIADHRLRQRISPRLGGVTAWSVSTPAREMVCWAMTTTLYGMRRLAWWPIRFTRQI